MKWIVPAVKCKHCGNEMPEPDTFCAFCGHHDIESLIQRASAGNSELQCELGSLYLHGVDVEQNYEEAFKWFQKAAEQDDIEGQIWLSECYENGWGVDVDKEKAINLFRVAEKHMEEQDDRHPLICKGVHCMYSAVSEEDYKEAIKWFDLSGEEFASTEGTYYTAICYYLGLGVPQDFDAARELFHTSFLLDSLEGGETDSILYGESEDWLKTSPDYIVSENSECPIQKEEYERWKEKNKWHFYGAIENEDPLARNCLGLSFYYGRGVPQNYRHAYKWFLYAEGEGCPDADYNLAKCYFFGHGVKQDKEEANRLFHQAAEQGHEEAKKWIESMPNE